MRVTAILKGATDKLERVPVQIRINEGDKRSFIPTKIKVRKSDWDLKTGKIKSSVPNAKVLNDAIKVLILSAELNEIAPTKKEKRTDFYKYAANCISGWEKTKAYNTLRDYAVQMSKLKSFSPTLLLDDINVAWLNAYKAHLFKGSATNVVWKALRFVRLIVKKAFREGLTKTYAFAQFESVIYKSPRKKFLTRAEIDNIEAALPDLPKGLHFAATWFLISCYTGLRYSDMHAFNKGKNIVGNRLIVTMQKTNEVIGMKVLPKVHTLLLSIDYAPLHYSNQPYNRLLKELTAVVQLPFPLTGHTSRHSFAMMCADAGMTQDVVAKFLGHEDIRSTAVYFKMTNKRLDDELDKLI